MDPTKGRHECRVCGARFALKASLRAHALKHGNTTSNPKELSETAEAAISRVTTYSESDKIGDQYHPVQADTSVQHLAGGYGAIRELDYDSSARDSALESDITSAHTVKGGYDTTYELDYDSSARDSALESDVPSSSHSAKGHYEKNPNSQLAGTHLVASSISETSEGKTPAVQGSMQKPAKTYSCKTCMRVFDNPSKLTQHNASSGHQQKMEAKAAGLLKTEEEPGSFPCLHPDCGKVFDNPSKLLQHQSMKKHEVGNLFACSYPDCGKSFDGSAKLLQHQMMKHQQDPSSSSAQISSTSENRYPCDAPECNRSFPSVDRLLQHQKDKHEDPVPTTHETGDPPTVPHRRLCDQCDEFNEASEKKTFIFLTYIAKHMIREHLPAGQSRGHCPICSQKVDKTKNLLTHVARVHLLSKFRDEACFICLRLCKDKNDLQQHTTSVHRFACLMDGCNSMYPSKDLRDKHMLQKHGVYVCGREDCQMIFSSLEEKVVHTNMPHPVDSDSDSSLRVVFQDKISYRQTLDTGVYSEPQRFLGAKLNDHPFSADEMRSTPVNRMTEPPQYAAHRLLKNHLNHLQTALQDLRQPLRSPVEPRISDETVRLCREVVADLRDIISDIENNEIPIFRANLDP